MTAREAIQLLSSLPPEQDVFLNWEGELVHVKEVRAVRVRQWADTPNGGMSEDYFPELESSDEDYRFFDAILID